MHVQESAGVEVSLILAGGRLCDGFVYYQYTHIEESARFSSIALNRRAVRYPNSELFIICHKRGCDMSSSLTH